MSNKGSVSCDECGAACCRYLAMEIDTPTCKRDYDSIRWYLLHDDVFVYVDHENVWHVEFATKCSKLGDDHLCQAYHDRPKICREHGEEDDAECEFHSDMEPHKIRFSNAKEYEAYLDHKGVKWKWKRQ